MNRPARLLFAALLAIPAGGAFSAGKVEEIPVLAQDLVTVRASNSLIAALWTRRPNSYTLQLVLGRGALPRGSGAFEQVGQRIVSRAARPAAGEQPPKLPETNVWLLRANGTQILPTSTSTLPSPEKCTLRCIAIEVLYRFSIADAEQAIAAAVKIGDDFYIEKLQPLVQVAD
jgi:hypothetical protein